MTRAARRRVPCARGRLEQPRYVRRLCAGRVVRRDGKQGQLPARLALAGQGDDRKTIESENHLGGYVAGGQFRSPRPFADDKPNNLLLAGDKATLVVYPGT